MGARGVKMTAMPQMVALFNGVGGGAAAFVSMAEFHRSCRARQPAPGRLALDPALGADRVDLVCGLDGGVREAPGAALGAADHLSRASRSSTSPVGALIAAWVAIVAGYEEQWVLVAMMLGALVFGVLFMLPIGGADMPFVISS